jgi:hypothetical protein
MKFKDYYDLEYAKLIAGRIKSAYPSFEDEAFAADIGHALKDQEFSERMDLFADAIEFMEIMELY